MTIMVCSGVTLIIVFVCLLDQFPMWKCISQRSEGSNSTNVVVECGIREWAYAGSTSCNSWIEACVHPDAEVRRFWVPRNQAGFAFAVFGLFANCGMLVGLKPMIT